MALCFRCKMYLCCAGTHTAIDATLFAVESNHILPNDVEAINEVVGPVFYNLLCDPLETKQQPRTIVDAQFSIPFTVACAVVDRHVGLAHFSQQGLLRSDLAAMARKVTARVDPNIRGIEGEACASVEIRLCDGAVHTARVETAKGHPDNAVTLDDLTEKFYQCADVAAKPLRRDKLDEAVMRIRRMEDVDDVRSIVDLLVT